MAHFDSWKSLRVWDKFFTRTLGKLGATSSATGDRRWGCPSANCRPFCRLFLLHLECNFFPLFQALKVAREKTPEHSNGCRSGHTQSSQAAGSFLWRAFFPSLPLWLSENCLAGRIHKVRQPARCRTPTPTPTSTVAVAAEEAAAKRREALLRKWKKSFSFAKTGPKTKGRLSGCCRCVWAQQLCTWSCAARTHSCERSIYYYFPPFSLLFISFRRLLGRPHTLAQLAAS